MTRKNIDCRTAPNDVGCTLAISGEPDELVSAAAQHAVAVHGHADSPELREQLRGLLAAEPATSGRVRARSVRPAHRVRHRAHRRTGRHHRPVGRRHRRAARRPAA